MIRVLQLIDSLGQGGAERSLVSLAPHLQAAEIEVAIACLKPDLRLAAPLSELGIDVMVLASSTRTRRIAELTALLDRSAFDLLHTTLLESMLVGLPSARRSRVPSLMSLVSTEFGRAHYASPNLNPMKVGLAQLAAIGASHLATSVHAVSESVADHMAPRLLLRRSRINVIPRGRDGRSMGRRTESRTLAVRKRLGWERDQPIILCVARHDFAKGLDIAVHCMHRLTTISPSARLIIAGSTGPATPILQSLISEFRLEASVDVLGFRTDVHDLMCGADILLFPSRREGMPGTIIEAMALELPIVASDIPAVREVMGPGPELAATEDADSFCRLALTALAGCSNRWIPASRARYEERFSIESSAGQLADLYRSVTKST